MNQTFEFLKALALTLAVEVPLLFVGTRWLLKVPTSKLPNRRLLFAGLLASSWTLPYLWFVLPRFIETYSLFLSVGELSVALLEAGLYSFTLKLNWKKALFLSGLCNLGSFLLGKIWH